MTVNNRVTLRAVFIFVLAALFLFYEMGVQVLPGIITEQLMQELQLNAVGLGVMSGFFYYTYTAMQIPAGLLYDRFHVRTLIVVPLLFCAIGAYLFSKADSLFLGSMGRMFIGTGAAFAFIGVLVVISDLFPARSFPLFVGITQALAALGAMCGGLPLIPFIEQYGWRSTLVGIAVVGFVLAGLTWCCVRYQKPKLREAESTTQSKVWQSLWSIFSNKQTWFVAIYACLLWAPMATFASLWGVPYLEKVFELGHGQAATVCSLMWIGLTVGSPILGWWSSHLQRRGLPLMIAALVGLIAFSLLMWAPDLPLGVVALLIFLAGAACAGQALSFSVVKDINPTRNIAAAIGFNNMAVVISGAIFQPLVGQLIQSHWDGKLIKGTAVYSAGDYQYGMSVLLACYFIGLLMSVFFIKESCSQVASSQQPEGAVSRS